MSDPEKPNMNSGIEGFIDDARRQKEESEHVLEGLEVEHEKFTEDEIARLLEIRLELAKIVELSRNDPDNQATYLRQTEDYLDNQDDWIMKFSTGEEGKSQSEDSMYYVMANGISLRLKRRNIEKGLDRVVQPFMETLHFEDDEVRPTEHLSLGHTPMEYCSQEFFDLQKGGKFDGEFVSPVKKYYEDQKLKHVEAPPRLFHEHNGTEINKVFFSKL